ncbi:mRNA cap guanine-N7 methyltransferase 2 isoform X1 [Quercus lobata]|uniref:mRNA cap guanine-N7 methyltransferase 2 isoform X1 n=1 Tax=Quercus lobata TaxID=97700 RepID=UPI0012466F67|nr:mRNA cap guanine-N7 methyltransferase 2 isoform X1 [Quercus lobata]
MSSQVVGLPNRSESSHQKLYEFAKMALMKIFAHPYATVCDLYCCGGGGLGFDNDAQIGHYIGIDVSSTGIAQLREAWESLSQKKPYPSDFFHFDPCLENMETHLKEKTNQADIVCCLQHLQLCFETEERARKLLQNVSCLLKPGGYFFGITPDSSTIWAKYQKNVEAYHNKGSSMKPNIVPNCIRSESYMITFEVEEEKFPLFGKKYQLKFASDPSAETHCLVHFPSFIRLAREAGLEYVEIQNLTEFYDDNRAQFAGMITNFVPNLVDPRGRLLPRSYDVLGLYTTFIFQKPDPDIAPPIMTPILQDTSYTHDERDWPAPGWRDDEKDGHTEPPLVLPKINDQKGILGPGPADLRFPEAL